MPNSVGYTVFSKAGFNCPYCAAAIELLDGEGLPYTIKKLPRSELLREAARAKMSSIPIIYHGVRLVGGYKELVLYLDR